MTKRCFHCRAEVEMIPATYVRKFGKLHRPLTLETSRCPICGTEAATSMQHDRNIEAIKLSGYMTVLPQGAMTPAQRQSRSRSRREDAGGKQIAVVLTPAAVAKLAQWQLRGLGIAEAINRLLERSRP